MAQAHDGPLAVRCPLERTERIIREARRAGVYDPARSVVRADDDHTEVPVTAPLADHDTVRQTDPRHRRRHLDDLVDVEDPPSSWSVVGDVVRADLRQYDPRDRRAIARGLAELHGAETVLDDRGPTGRRRKPRARVVWGSTETETEHREHGYRFRLDPRRVMFSCGNAGERRRMERVVADGERVLDMFAGIGYFAVPMALGGAEVVATEIDATAHRYLETNATLNAVDDLLEARHTDCREVDGRYDRVVMGHFDSPWYVAHAVERLRDGGVIHLHVGVPVDDDAEDGAQELLTGIGVEPAAVAARTVKPMGSRLRHVVVDCRIS